MTDLQHIGTETSGRYPLGSGENPFQRPKTFLDNVKKLEGSGLKGKALAEALGLTTTQLRAYKAIAKAESRAADETKAQQYKDDGLSNVKIGLEMGINESSVRALLNPSAKARNDILRNTAEMIREQISKHEVIDIGAGVNVHLDMSKEKLATAVAMLEAEGYKKKYFKVAQLGTEFDTSHKTLVGPDFDDKADYHRIAQNLDLIKQMDVYSQDAGKTFERIKPPKSLSPDRITILYGSEGGADRDGLIELRRGVDDISLGNSKYAQVRILVGKDQYLKGMAMYSDDLPPGADVRFNTNKEKTSNKLDAMKPIDKNDKLNPFGSVTYQKHYIDSNGKQQLSVHNIVNEEGVWYDWSRNLSSQMLSKQPPKLAKEQLDLTYSIKKNEFDEINALTNPTVKRKLMESFADDADSSARHLAAASLPKTRQHVLLPFNSIRDSEIYAPQYKNGDNVVLIRHPHGGIFEIPELKVNNRNPEAKRAIGAAIDAVGINARVASVLSGADFDGDTVLVIPNPVRKIKTRSPLQQLKGFEPQIEYPGYPGMKQVGEPGGGQKQKLMGDISNLITDMSVKKAPHEELARAVKHSMVVIDAEKHGLNYKQSAIDNGIQALKKKYQGKANAGAATLVSKASSQERVLQRKPKLMPEGPINRVTGEKQWDYTGDSYVNKKGVVIEKTSRSTKMDEARDAYALSSGTSIEAVYANHANKLKGLGNTARKTAVNIKPPLQSPSAKKIYASEIKSLSSKLAIAQKNAPLERSAQVLATSIVNAKKESNPNMDKDALKKARASALNEARNRTGAGKKRITIEPPEWNAIQAGAISNTRLMDILNNTDLDVVKKLATPRESKALSASKEARIRSMMMQGYTQSEVAEALGVSTSTITAAVR